MSGSHNPNDDQQTQDLDANREGSELDAGLEAAFQSDSVKTLAETTAKGDRYAPGFLLASRYKLVEAIGEGGMGAVWLAEQKEPVKRKVAVKLVKAGMDSRSVLARFEAERQALAMMDHPNIAKVLDGGVTEQGRPYFVMELVKGIPLTEYCDQVQFSIPERLELFGQVCSAVQHAHQKGIIHRDLKPSNVLVTEVDGRPVVKVIDFGLAKALHGSQVLTDQSLHTAFGAVLGTPLYMAPEQLGTSALDVDTRADLYSLGVILYELLTGTTPIERQQLKQAAFEEMCRLIREQEPPRPSTRLSSSDSLPGLAVRRHAEPAKLTRLVRGELDWIVMKALEKDRNRRYETANGLAMDVHRYLAGEAVLAAPPSKIYRLQKFIRRNRGTVLATSLLILLLVVGTISTSLAMLEARRQTARVEQEVLEKEAARVAESEQREKAEVAEQTALRAAESARQARELEQQQRKRAEAALIDAEKAEQVANYARELEARQRHELEQSQIELKKSVEDERQQRAFAEAINRFVVDDILAMTSVEGQSRFGGEGLDRNTTVFQLLERAAEKLKAQTDLDPLIEAELCWIVGVNLRASGEAEKALQFLERSLELRKQNLGDSHPQTLNSYNSVAVCLSELGETDKALVAYMHVLDMRIKDLGPTHPETLMAMNNLASGYSSDVNLSEAIRLREQALELMKEHLTLEHVWTLKCLSGLVADYLKAKLFDKAIPLAEQSIELHKKVMGSDHVDTMMSVGNLANGYSQLGQHDRALPLFETVVDSMKHRLGDEHSHSLHATRLLANGYLASGQFQKSQKLLEKVVESMTTKNGADHPLTLATLAELSKALLAAGQPDEAIALSQQIYELTRAKFPAEHLATVKSRQLLGVCYANAGKLELAIPILKETLEQFQMLAGPTHSDTLRTLISLATTYKLLNRFEDAIPLFEQLMESQTATLGDRHFDTLATMDILAGLYSATERLDLAIQFREQTFERSRDQLGIENPMVRNRLSKLAHDCWLAGRLDRSVEMYERLVLIEERLLGRNHSDTQIEIANLGVNYKEAGRFEEGIALLEECLRLAKQPADVVFLKSKLLEAYSGAKRDKDFRRMADEDLATARRDPATDPLDLATLLMDNGRGYLKLDGFSEAVKLLREALTIREQHIPDDWRTFYTRSLLGYALLATARGELDDIVKSQSLAEAESLLVLGYTGMLERQKTVPPANAVQTHEAINYLIELYTLLDKPKELERYHQLRSNFVNHE